VAASACAASFRDAHGDEVIATDSTVWPDIGHPSCAKRDRSHRRGQRSAVTPELNGGALDQACESKRTCSEARAAGPRPAPARAWHVISVAP